MWYTNEDAAIASRRQHVLESEFKIAVLLIGAQPIRLQTFARTAKNPFFDGERPWPTLHFNKAGQIFSVEEEMKPFLLLFRRGVTWAQVVPAAVRITSIDPIKRRLFVVRIRSLSVLTLDTSILLASSSVIGNGV